MNPIDSNYPDLYVQYQPKEEVPTPAKPEIENNDVEVFKSIDWDKRLLELKPTPRNNPRIMRPVGAAFAALSAYSAKVTLGLALTFSSTPFGVITVVAAAAITTVALGAFGMYHLFRSYINPQTIIQAQKELVETIKNDSKLTWSTVSFRLQQINLNLDNEELYTIFFARELSSLSYDQFYNKHGLILDKLTETGFNRLKKLFIKSLPSKALNEIEYAMSVFKINVQTVWDVIGDNEVRRGYSSVVQRKGGHAWPQLTESQTKALRASFLKALPDSIEYVTESRTLRSDAERFRCLDEFDRAAKAWFQMDSAELMKTGTLTQLRNKYRELSVNFMDPESPDFQRMLADYLIKNINSLDWYFLNYHMQSGLIIEPIKGYLETYKNELEQLKKAYEDEISSITSIYNKNRNDLNQNPKLLEIAQASLPIQLRHDAIIDALVKEMEALDQRIATTEKQLKDCEQKIKDLEQLHKQYGEVRNRLCNLRQEYSNIYNHIPRWESAVKAFDQRLQELNYDPEWHATIQNRLDLMQRIVSHGSVQNYRTYLQTKVAPTGLANAIRAVGNYGQAIADLKSLENLGAISVETEISNLTKNLEALSTLKRSHDQTVADRTFPAKSLEDANLLKNRINECLNQEASLQTQIQNQDYVTRAKIEGAQLSVLRLQRSQLEVRLHQARNSKAAELATLQNEEIRLNASIAYQQQELRNEFDSALAEEEQAYKAQTEKSSAAFIANLELL